MVVITVLSVGGSLINKENGIDDGFLKRISSILGDNGGKFGIVTGGGGPQGRRQMPYALAEEASLRQTRKR